jgi:hypothetical protein
MRRRPSPPIPAYAESIVSGKEGFENYEFTSDEEVKETDK